MSARRMLVGVVTAPRPGPSYLASTVAQVLCTCSEVGVDVVVAPTFRDDVVGMSEVVKQNRLVEVLPPFWDEDQVTVLGRDKDHRGLERNSQRLLAHLLSRAHNYNGWVISAQDDLEICKRTIDRAWLVAQHCDAKRPGVGAVTFYTPYLECGRHRRALWPYPNGKFYGDLFILWKAECARAYNAAANMYEGRDIDIAKWFSKQTTWSLMGHNPCLIQHAGVVSATGKDWNSGTRQTMNYRSFHNAVEDARPWL